MDGLRTLYLPIFEPGAYHDRALANKHGLRTAFEALGPVLEWDYLTNDRATLYDGLVNRMDQFQPDIVFTQIGPDAFTGDQIQALRERYPSTRWANWNGDYWPEVLLAPVMIDVLRAYDVQLVVNGTVLPDYEREGVRAAFWPFGYETPVRDVPDAPAYDVLYLGNCYSDERRALYEVLRGLPYRVGIYGNGWPACEGECTYDFTYGEALYQNARLTIADSQWPDADGYLSNRPFQALAAGCFLLQQNVRRLDELTGLKDGVHYIGFDTLAELPALVDYWLAPAQETHRQQIALAGKAHVRAHHSWERRVEQLIKDILPAVEEVR